jgi:tetratricopeptide (TPR) repeat protein
MRLDKRFRGERPIVFVCHSLGGLLAKQILRQAHDNAGDAGTHAISRRTAAVLFLATPHHGADLASLIDNFAAIFGPTASLTALKAHDPPLRNLYNWYRNHAPKLDIATETYFEGRDVFGFRIVNETSSQPGVGPDAVMLDEDHLSIAKPRERDAQVCLALEEMLRGVIARATVSPDRGATIVGNLPVTKAADFPDTDSPETESRASLDTRIAPPSSPIPPNLRLADYGFFGRTEQQARLLQRLRAGQTTAVVGGPGLGKTALVAKVLRTLLGDTDAAQRQALAGLPFPDGIVFLDLYALHGQADQAWEALASAVAPQTPDDAGAMPARERAIAACRGKRFLLVVEGGEEARGTADPGDYARSTRHELLDPLALQGPVLWLTRSAAQSNKNEWVRIDTTLDIDDARELFDAIAGTDVPRTVRDAALEALHGHPLAITWVAALIAREDEPPDLLLADLRRQPSLLQLQDPERPHRTLRWLFDRSLRGLDADARRSLLAAGLLAADAFPLEAIAAGTGLDGGAQREALRACVQAHLLRWQQDDGGAALWRFGHALAYGYAREQARVEPETAAALLPGLAGWAHATLGAGLAANAPPAATAVVSRTLAHALALLAADTPPGLWWPLVEDLLYDFSDRFVALGQLTRALEAREAVARWLTQAQAAQPDEARWQRESGTCHQRLGNLDLAQGNLPGAQQHYTAALTIAERLAAKDPAHAGWQRDVSVSHIKLGDVQVDQGDLPGAQQHYAAGLAITERLAAQDPANADLHHGLSISHERLGNVQQAQGDLPGAQRHYETVLSIRERLAVQGPANAQWQRELSVIHNKLGAVLQAQGDLPGAQRHYAADLAIAERLAAQDPAHAGWQRDLSVSHEKLGEVQQAQGDLPGAQRHYAAALAIRERLAAQDPANAGWQRDLSVSHGRLGDVQKAQGDLPGAQEHYAADLAIAERLAAQDPANAGWQHDLAVSRIKLAGVCEADGDLPGALAHLQAAREILQALRQRAPEYPQFQRDLAIVEQGIATLEEDDAAP